MALIAATPTVPVFLFSVGLNDNHRTITAPAAAQPPVWGLSKGNDACQYLGRGCIMVGLAPGQTAVLNVHRYRGLEANCELAFLQCCEGG
jgi:hypothetical protein